jgi:hypothetical protein
MKNKIYNRSVKILTSATVLSLLIHGAAKAMDTVAPIEIDGGPLGTLQLSGAADGYFYTLSGAGNANDEGELKTDKAAGAEFFNGQIKIVKPTGLIQFTVDFHPNNSYIIGKAPTGPNTGRFSLGPIYAAFITLQPAADWKFSAGQLYTVEGMESSMDWLNANVFQSTLYTVRNSSSRGVSATYTHDKLYATAIYGDGFDTGIWNYVQGNIKYFFNPHNMLGVYGATPLSRTPLTALAYGLPTSPYGACTVSCYGANFVNSTIIGGYYKWSAANFYVEPEIQYVYAKEDKELNLLGYSSSFGMALFSDYKFANTPWSFGDFVEYFSSNGPDSWGIGPRAAGWAVSLAPTWQRNNLFARADFGLIHLTKVGTAADGSKALLGYGSDGLGRNEAAMILEGGVVF